MFCSKNIICRDIYPLSSNVASGCKRSSDQKVSLLNAVFLESKGALALPGRVTGGAEISIVSPFESKNYIKQEALFKFMNNVKLLYIKCEILLG